ncbi:MAG: glycerate kinase [Bacteroidota bacterium]
MTILLAPNAMKGSLTAQQCAVILRRSLLRKYPTATIISLPVADGGNGTLECLMNALGGTMYEKEVTGPIPSLKVNARYGITTQHIAIIESAEAIGLQHITPSPETIAQSTSRGVGELLLAVLKHPLQEIWIGLGGTATNDGGAGLARALGIEILNEYGKEVTEGAVHLTKVSRIDFQLSEVATQIKNRKLKILCDVHNSLLGNDGATYTFAPQKGATEEQLPYLEAALKNFADIVETTLGKTFRAIPGSGAAGGLGFGLLAFCNAQRVPGIDFILNAIGFDNYLQQCDFVITTEGTIDKQTLLGKGIFGITQRAKKFGKPVHAFVGRIQGEKANLQHTLGLASLIQISPDDLPTPQAMHDASWLLADAVYHHKFQ